MTNFLLDAETSPLRDVIAVLEARRQTLVAASAGTVLVGALLALIGPGLLPPHPLVGAAVGLAAVLLGVAAAYATDANDLIVRGARHIRAAGTRAAAIIAPIATPEGGARLVELIGTVEPGRRLVVAVAPASKNVRAVPAWADHLAMAFAAGGRHVVAVDLTGLWGDIDDPGVVDVARGAMRLSEAVTFDPELTVARLGTGADPHAAREAVVGFLARVPRDVDMVVLAMPSLSMAGALTALGAADRALVLAETGVTNRMALIGTLDAIDDTGVSADVILLETPRAVPSDAGEPDPGTIWDPPRLPEDAGVDLPEPEPLVMQAPSDPPTQPQPVGDTVDPHAVRPTEPVAVMSSAHSDAARSAYAHSDAAHPAHDVTEIDVTDRPSPATSGAVLGSRDGGATAEFPIVERVELDGRSTTGDDRDAVRVAAALGSFAEEVWRRGDGS